MMGTTRELAEDLGVVTMDQAAKLKGLRSYRSVWDAVNKGRLPARKMGGTWLIKLSDLDNWHPVLDVKERSRKGVEALRRKRAATPRKG